MPRTRTATRSSKSTSSARTSNTATAKRTTAARATQTAPDPNAVTETTSNTPDQTAIDQARADGDKVFDKVMAARARGTGVEGTLYIEADNQRTAEEKIAALAKAAEAAATNPEGKSLVELTNNVSTLGRAIIDIVNIFERSFNIDFLSTASVAEVHSGIAAQRAAVSIYGESPEQVDDAVVPPGVTNPTDEILPPNIPAGEKIPGTDEAPAH